MHFTVDPTIFNHHPKAKIGVIVLQNINNEKKDLSITQFLEEVVTSTAKNYAGKSISDHPKVRDWRTAHRSFGSSKPASLEALLKRVVKNHALPTINALVDLYNTISIQYELPIGAYDLDQITDHLSLTFADGSETFIPLGKTSAEPVLSGEVIYRDEKEVLCSKWNYRQSDRAKIERSTKNAVIFLEGLDHTSLSEIAQAMQKLVKLVHHYCAGSSTLYLLDRSHPAFSEASKLENRLNAISCDVPAYHHHEAFQTRKKKLDAIRKLGIDPYPHHFECLVTINALQKKCDKKPVGTSEDAAKKQTAAATVAGRIVLFRAMGKNAFAQLQDEADRIQVMFNRDQTVVKGLSDQAGMTSLKFIEKNFDLGDIIGVKGHLFRTQKGELTLFADEVTLLSKSLLPLPDKYSGLTDKGTRYRKRWLDLITHREVGFKLKQRSFLISKIRRYFEEANFIEVETPVLQNLYGGAEARPFTTELHALNQKMYLRIALEIALKKLIIGGMTHIFEIGKVFRNEGIDRTHNPEFTMLEAYAAYWDYHDVMVFVENLFAHLAIELYGTTVIGTRHDKEGNPHLIDLQTPWKRMTMKDAIKTYGQIDSDALSTEDIRRKLQEETPVDQETLKKAKRGKLIAYLFEEFAEHHLMAPHHILDHPIETTPLCKLHRNPEEREQNIVERFETFILGCEICNAYSELNDPELQRKLLQDQNELRQQGDVEASPMDEEFIEAMCQGMPPTGGFGIGIDRLVMLFNDAFSIRDVIYFPLMRPED